MLYGQNSTFFFSFHSSTKLFTVLNSAAVFLKYWVIPCRGLHVGFQEVCECLPWANRFFFFRNPSRIWEVLCILYARGQYTPQENRKEYACLAHLSSQRFTGKDRQRMSGIGSELSLFWRGSGEIVISNCYSLCSCNYIYLDVRTDHSGTFLCKHRNAYHWKLLGIVNFAIHCQRKIKNS